MARKKVGAPGPDSGAVPPVTAPQPPQVMGFKPVLEITDDAFVYYANYAEVSQSPSELSITFGRMPTKLSLSNIEELQTSGSVTTEAAVQILLSPGVARNLVNVLSLQLSQFDALQQFQQNAQKELNT